MNKSKYITFDYAWDEDVQLGVWHDPRGKLGTGDDAICIEAQVWYANVDAVSAGEADFEDRGDYLLPEDLPLEGARLFQGEWLKWLDAESREITVLPAKGPSLGGAEAVAFIENMQRLETEQTHLSNAKDRGTY